MVTSFIVPYCSLRSFGKKSFLFLALFWSFGLVTGCIFSLGGGASFLSWMRAADHGSVSIVSLFATVFLPFLFSAFAVYCQQGWLIYFLAFFRMFSFGFCAAGVMCCYGSAGWLVCSLLFFSDLVILPWLYGFFCLCLSGKRRSLKLSVTLVAALVFFVVTIDRCFISPFLASLL